MYASTVHFRFEDRIILSKNVKILQNFPKIFHQ